jgi:hypothetical protein
MYRTIFKVRGIGEFPFDMLRYCSTFPWTETDSYLLGESHHEFRTVTLARFSSDKNPLIETPRWQSFGWTVVEVGKPEKT